MYWVVGFDANSMATARAICFAFAHYKLGWLFAETTACTEHELNVTRN